MTLFDTDIVIDAMGGVIEAVEILDTAEAEGTLAITAVTQMELITGCENKRELRALSRFLRHFYIAHMMPGVSARAVDLMEQYRLSHGLLMPDALIAATALDDDHFFATKNRKDFRFIPGLKLLEYP